MGTILGAVLGGAVLSLGAVLAGIFIQRWVDKDLREDTRVQRTNSAMTRLDSQVQVAMDRIENRAASGLPPEEPPEEHPGGPPQPMPGEKRKGNWRSRIPDPRKLVS